MGETDWKPEKLLGQREQQALEFKSAQALSRPFTISREAVAMLNASGGDILIGIREHEGVASGFEPIADAEARRIGLLNHLIDVIEPALTPGEAEIRALPATPGIDVLRLRLTPIASHRPYALMESKNRQYLLRVDHRIRHMTREEIHGQSAPSGIAESPEQYARAQLIQRRMDQFQRPGSFLWVGIEPVPGPLSFDVQSPVIRELLMDPKRSGNRVGGYSFHTPFVDPKYSNAGIQVGVPTSGVVAISTEGKIEFSIPLARLDWDENRPQQLHPYVLLELVVSLTRLAAGVYGPEGVGHGVERMLGDIAVIGGKNWSLPAHPPGTWGYLKRHDEPARMELDNLDIGSPRSFAREELLTNPDRPGVELVRALYQAFGLPRDRLPQDVLDATDRFLPLD